MSNQWENYQNYKSPRSIRPRSGQSTSNNLPQNGATARPSGQNQPQGMGTLFGNQSVSQSNGSDNQWQNQQSRYSSPKPTVSNQQGNFTAPSSPSVANQPQSSTNPATLIQKRKRNQALENMLKRIQTRQAVSRKVENVSSMPLNRTPTHSTQNPGYYNSSFTAPSQTSAQPMYSKKSNSASQMGQFQSRPAPQHSAQPSRSGQTAMSPQRNFQNSAQSARPSVNNLGFQKLAARQAINADRIQQKQAGVKLAGNQYNSSASSYSAPNRRPLPPPPKLPPQKNSLYQNRTGFASRQAIDPQQMGFKNSKPIRLDGGEKQYYSRNQNQYDQKASTSAYCGPVGSTPSNQFENKYPHPSQISQSASYQMQNNAQQSPNQFNARESITPVNSYQSQMQAPPISGYNSGFGGQVQQNGQCGQNGYTMREMATDTPNYTDGQNLRAASRGWDDSSQRQPELSSYKSTPHESSYQSVHQSYQTPPMMAPQPIREELPHTGQVSNESMEAKEVKPVVEKDPHIRNTEILDLLQHIKQTEPLKQKILYMMEDGEAHTDVDLLRRIKKTRYMGSVAFGMIMHNLIELFGGDMITKLPRGGGYSFQLSSRFIGLCQISFIEPADDEDG